MYACSAKTSNSDLGHCVGPWCGTSTTLVPHPPSAPHSTPLLPLTPTSLQVLSTLFYCSPKAMEDLSSGLSTLPRAGRPTTLSPTSLAHSAAISNDTLNDLLRFIGSQKCSGFPELNSNTVDSSNSPLDSDGLQILDSNILLTEDSSSGLPTNPHIPPLGPAVNTRRGPQIAYSLDTISPIGQSDKFNQASTL